MVVSGGRFSNVSRYTSLEECLFLQHVSSISGEVRIVYDFVIACFCFMCDHMTICGRVWAMMSV